MKTTIKDTAALDALDHYPEKCKFSNVRMGLPPSPGDPISNYEQQLTGEVVALRAQLHKTRFCMFLFAVALGMQIILWFLRIGTEVFNSFTR